MAVSVYLHDKISKLSNFRHPGSGEKVSEDHGEHAFFFNLDGAIGSGLAREGVKVVDFPGGGGISELYRK